MIRLTQTVQKGGCAAKLPAGELRKVLADLKLQKPRELLVGTETLDDACLWDLGDGMLLVETVDFFTPIVDEPYDYGAIAAANALSDVYAMGGFPKIALSVLAFPSKTLPTEILKPILTGALDKIHEAGACLAGGHTIDDETLKLGFCVTGFVKKDRQWTNTGAREGDVLILTKPLGTGTITSALKGGQADPAWVKAATDSMMTLNRAPDLLDGITIHAATDITGFGLAGHSLQMAQASGVSFTMRAESLPWVHGAKESLNADWLNRAHKTNKDYTQDHIEWECKLPDKLRWIVFDPQTSGGLLLSVPEEQGESAVARLKVRFPNTRVIGSVRKDARKKVLITD